jgi:pimeloyl-ACP methyl ester carboxylesterase
MPYVCTENGNLYFEVHGTGRPVVLLHGAWASSRWWKHQIPELSQSYRVYAVDIRGHGASDDLNETASIESFSDDLRIFIQEEDIVRPALIGWSMGGMIALQYCMNHPGAVSALILIASRAQRSRRMKVRVTLQYLKVMLGMLTVFAEPRNYDPAAPAPAPAPVKRELLFRSEVRRMLSPSASEELIRWIAAELARTPTRNYFEVAKSMWNWEAGPGLSEIEVPTLILSGEHDTVTDPAYSTFMHEQIPGSRLIILKSTGHYAALEQPEIVNTAIIKFFKEIGY